MNVRVIVAMRIQPLSEKYWKGTPLIVKKTSKSSSRERKLLRIGQYLVIFCLAVLTGCGEPKMQDHYQEYLSRLARVLGQDLPDWRAQSLVQLSTRYPSAKERSWQVSDIRVGVFDFLALDECNLLPLISERNSSLGKFMSATSRYQYEWMIVRGVEHCIGILAAQSQREELVTKLKEVSAVKQQELSKHYWNATWGSVEFQQFFSLSKPVLSQQEAQGLKSPALVALAAYFSLLPALEIEREALSLPIETAVADEMVDPETAALDGPWAAGVFAESAVLENQLQPLQYHYGGRLLKSLVMASSAINVATQLVSKSMAERPICFDQKPSQKATILKNVLHKYYVAALQPYLSRIDKEAGHLWNIFAEHDSKLLNDVKPGVANFRDHYFFSEFERGVLDEFRQSMKIHAQQWSKLLEHCGLSVGNAP